MVVLIDYWHVGIVYVGRFVSVKTELYFTLTFMVITVVIFYV